MGRVLLELISATDKNGLKTIYPDGNYTRTEVCVQINGIEVPADVLRNLFGRYLNYYVRKEVKTILKSVVDDAREQLWNLQMAMDDSITKICSDHGLDPKEYDD